jgi:hypothetical protein
MEGSADKEQADWAIEDVERRILLSRMSTIPLHSRIPFKDIGEVFHRKNECRWWRLKVGTNHFSWES